jgi:rhamnosyltransferase
MDRPRILVLLAAYNGAPWIVRQINSILSQVNVDVDVVVGDDCSSDNTPEQLTHFLSEPRVKLVSSVTPTGSAAQNFFSLICGASAERYDFVAFADQDDIWHPEKLENACTTLRNSGADAYSSSVTAFWEDGTEIILRQQARLTCSDFLFEGAGQGCSFVLHTSFYMQVRHFLLSHRVLVSDVHFHDWAVYALSRTWGRRWIFDPRSFMLYRQHAGNDTGARSSLTGVRKRLNLIKTGWYSRQLRSICAVCRDANPSFSMVSKWYELMCSPPGTMRKIRMIRFCLRGGRRSRFDNAILLGAIAAGWI